MKKILIGVLVLIVAVVGIVVTQLGPIVEAGFETQGPKTLHASVEVGSVSISPLSGKISITDFAIGQPKGFGDGPLVSLGEFKMKIEPTSLLSNHIMVETVEILSPLFDIRMIDGKTNIKALQDGIEMPATAAGAAAEASSDEITLTIKSLVVKSPRLLATTDGFIKLDEDIQLADFTLTNLGTDEKGLAPREIARHIMDALQPQITKALITAGASNKLQEIAKGAKGNLEKGLMGLLGKLAGKKKKEN